MTNAAHKQSNVMDDRRVRQHFSKVSLAQESQFLLREISQRMQEKLDLVNIHPQHIVDMGCGMGADMTMLQSKYPQAKISGVDCSAELLRQAKLRHGSHESHDLHDSSWLGKLKKHWAGRDPSTLSFNYFCQSIEDDLPSMLFDIIWSNAVLHWHMQPHILLQQWFNLIQEQGLLMFSCFGPDTFKEVRQAFVGIDEISHTLQFVDMHDYGDMLVKAGFATPVMDIERLTLQYDSVDRLLLDIRALGRNPLSERKRLTKSEAKSFRQNLENTRDSEGKLSLSIELIFGHAFKPEKSNRKAGEHVIQFQKKLEK